FPIIILTWITLPFGGYCQDFWEPIPYPNSTESMSCFAMDGYGRLFACNVDDVFYTDDMGVNWYYTTNWPDQYPRCMVTNASDDVFIVTYSGNIFRSTDRGVSFHAVSNGLTADFLRCLIVLDNDVLLLGTSEGIFRSVDNGDFWEPYGTGLPDGWIDELSAGADGKIFAGTQLSGVYRSYDYGATWTAANNGLPAEAQVTSILTVPGETSAYAGLYPQGMFFSSDDGDSWAEHNEGLPFDKDLLKGNRDYSAHGLTYLQQMVFIYIYSQVIYYALQYSVPPSPWYSLISGLPPDSQINALRAVLATILVCATLSSNDVPLAKDGPGIYVNAVPVNINAYAAPSSVYQLSIVPNPVSGSSNIRINMPEKGRAILSLCNQLGQEIMRIADQELSEGIHDFNLNALTLDPGLYFLKLISKNEMISTRVLSLN
ncbi:MAG TPA: T9SS type A sorting domain-containing protein, partial [Bacteroidales bacterium]|nr:T9SS type A sorting domain-containing protein [Bacteroidales bacterium]